MLASEILTEARYILSDTSKERWSDARLISLLNDGLVDLTCKVRPRIEHAYVELLNGVSTYYVPDVAEMLEIRHNDTPISFYSYEEMNQRYAKWEHETGQTPKAIVYNRRDIGEFRVYPIPEELSNNAIESNTPYGIITEFDVLDTMVQPIIEGLQGDLDGTDGPDFVKVIYSVRLPEVQIVDDEIDVDRTYKETLKHYIAGHAFRDNADTQNRAVGQEELQIYGISAREDAIKRSKDFTQNNYNTSYRGIE